MKKLILATSILALAACGRVMPGEEGVIVNQFGDGKGVDAKEVSVGWVFYGPGKDLVTYPIFEQVQVFENITFQDRDGLKLTVSVGVNYWVLEGFSAELYQQYRKEADEIINQFVLNSMKNEFNRITASMTAEEIYSTQRNALLDEVLANLQAIYEAEGIHIKSLYWASEIDLPPQVKTAINAKIEATQIAAQRRNEVEQSKAQADKDVAKAEGVAKSILVEAEARAKAIELEGQAIRANPQVLELRAIEKWEGVLPNTLVTDGSSNILLAPATGK